MSFYTNALYGEAKPEGYSEANEVSQANEMSPAKPEGYSEANAVSQANEMSPAKPEGYSEANAVSQANEMSPAKPEGYSEAKPEAKPVGLNCDSMLSIPEHRSGWNYVKSLCEKHLHGPKGPILVDFVEKIWCWKPENASTKDIYFKGHSYTVPIDQVKMIRGVEYVVVNNQSVYWNGTEWSESLLSPAKVAEADTYGVFTTPWVGMIHNPTNMPEWFDFMNSPQALIQKRNFQRSLPYCKGLIVFSKNLRHNLLRLCDWPCEIYSVTHPTEPVIPLPTWKLVNGRLPWLQCLFHKPKYRLVQVGYWLRRLTSIWEVQVPPNWEKYWINRADHGFVCLEKEIFHEHKGKTVTQNTVHTLQLSNEDYDQFLSRSVMFIDLYDSSCNNTIIEAIVRHVPIVTRRLPSTEEYLGKDYVLFFDSLDDVEELLTPERLYHAHEQLRELERSGRFYGENFVHNMLKVVQKINRNKYTNK
jgi:hypothetical protein